MIPRIPTDPRLRAERKADLLMASELLRGQAQSAVDDLGGRADGLVRRVEVGPGLEEHLVLVNHVLVEQLDVLRPVDEQGAHAPGVVPPDPNHLPGHLATRPAHRDGVPR